MGYYDIDYLEHHGVLGQKWGVRRFQRLDGTRTAAGKSRLVNKTNKKHKFVDKAEVSIDRRKDAADSVLSMWGATSAAAAMGATMGALTGTGPIGAALGAGVMSTHLAVISTAATANFIVKDAKAKKAEAKEKKFAEERAQNPIDKKTGFHKKTKEMSPEEDMERVNPAYKNWDDNTKSNCVLCTMAYELRRRGYDVQAKKATSGYNGTELPKDWFPGAKTKESEGSMSDLQITETMKKGIAPRISKENKTKMIDNTVSEIQNQKDGARGQITVTWDGSFSGHSVAYANEGGKVVIYDAQANERYEDAAARKYLNRCSQVSVMRLDNCDVNVKYIKEVAK